MTLELADRSITRLKGVAEDVFIKVGKFHFLTNFVVVDFEADPRVPLILGRSFLRTGRALIDVYGEEITLRVNDEAVTFNLNQTTRYSSTYDDLSVNQIDVIDVAKEETFQRCMMAIFYDMIEKTMEVFMDDFSVFADSFDTCLSNLERMSKRTVGENHASWSDKLDDALWAFRTAFKTLIGCTPYKLTTGDHRKLQLNELNELRDQAYKNSLIYKERTKKLHDSKIKNRIFNVGD
nr:reverse transcriptase domain-containing protein [Tanacetum cinerariifolium]